jgi:hypothetical protein
VRTIEPVTEASSAAVLVSFLTIFGAMVGPGPYVLADGARHAARLFTLIVGKTSRARKGTSYRQAKFVFDYVDKGFVERRVLGGFGSGEALIEAAGGVVEDGEDDAEPPAPRDPRLLIVEEEFSRVLRVSERDGSTLSQVVRQAWDGANLAALTRKRPVRAKGAHICALGHITEDELLARMRGVEIANGFANRFLFTLAVRSKRLPDGGGLHRDEAERLAYQWATAGDKARAIERVGRSREADAIWRDWYFALDDDRPGMLGALLARAEAQVLRLSLVYALVDGEATIDAPHLYAALDVWRYAEQSVLAIFGDAVGDPLADLILRELRDRGGEGMSRTQIREAIGHHERATAIEAALDLLESRNLARCERVPTAGRSAERWYALFAPEGREETGGKANSLPSLPFLRSEQRGRKPARADEAEGMSGEEASLPSRPLRGSSDNQHLVCQASSGDHLHDQSTPPERQSSEAELRRWAAEEKP